MKISYLLAAMVLLCWTADVAFAQSPEIRVNWNGDDLFGVSVIAPNETPAGAGSIAMRRACDVAQERDHVYLAVIRYSKNSSSKRVLVERGREVYRAGADGVPRPVGYEADSYQTISVGDAYMFLQMISQGTISSLRNTYAVIESEGCTVFSTPSE